MAKTKNKRTEILYVRCSSAVKNTFNKIAKKSKCSVADLMETIAADMRQDASKR